MENQRLLFESSPVLIIPCILLGIGYAYVLYHAKAPWSKRVNQLLFGIRALLVAFLAMLLVGPIIKLTSNQFEKPSFVLLVDNSSSVGEVIDSAEWQDISGELGNLGESLEDAGYDYHVKTLSGDVAPITFTNTTSDLNSAMREIAAEYEGRKLDGVILLSDGIYNSGASPLFTPMGMPVYTIGLGDTTQRTDLILKNLVFNKIAYQGNQFPLRTEVIVQGTRNQEVVVSLFQKGKLIKREQRNSGNNTLLNFDFQVDANEQGLQRLDVSVEPLSIEHNRKNNYASAYVEVVEGKKTILVVAPSPHPDIKALRSVIEKNSNYEFVLHIPGVVEAPAGKTDPTEVDLVIFHQVLDVEGKTLPLYNRFINSPVSMMMIIGSKSNLRQLAAAKIPVTFESPGQWDEVTPVVNSQFRNFTFSENSGNIFSRFPPVSVPFGKLNYPPQSNVLLFQRIGSVATDRPLLFTLENESKRQAILIGEGIWRWRLDEYAETRGTEAFDDVFSKLIQYTSTREDKRKFRCFPIQSEFTDAEAVVFESQVYNDLFEQVYGNRIDLQVTGENGDTKTYNYNTGPGNTRYRIGGLKEGVYKYSASTQVDGKTERAAGEFLVRAQNIEMQNLTADFGLLKKWADNSGGKFYRANEIELLSNELSAREAQSLIHTEETFDALINLKIFFFLLLLLVSVEWFLRKYLGSY